MLVFVQSVVFFKQKTADEMRMSDWSSDVCSSDLDEPAHRLEPGQRQVQADREQEKDDPELRHDLDGIEVLNEPQSVRADDQAGGEITQNGGHPQALQHRHDDDGGEQQDESVGEEGGLWHRGPARDEEAAAGAKRSEEHTSELQSLMRISYAVF